MTARKYIINPKTIDSSTQWKQGSVPKKHAPFFKKPLPLNDFWSWREAKLKGDGNEVYRLLVMYRMDDKRHYKAWLSIEVGGETKEYAIVCRYEDHGSHGGLHCHLLCNYPHYPIGEIEPAGLLSFPNWKNSKHSHLELMSLNQAWNFALKFYRVGASNEGSLI
jgi:hypothetical protein